MGIHTKTKKAEYRIFLKTLTNLEFVTEQLSAKLEVAETHLIIFEKELKVLNDKPKRTLSATIRRTKNVITCSTNLLKQIKENNTYKNPLTIDVPRSLRNFNDYRMSCLQDEKQSRIRYGVNDNISYAFITHYKVAENTCFVVVNGIKTHKSATNLSKSNPEALRKKSYIKSHIKEYILTPEEITKLKLEEQKRGLALWQTT